MAEHKKETDGSVVKCVSDDNDSDSTYNEPLFRCLGCGNIWDGNAQCLCIDADAGVVEYNDATGDATGDATDNAETGKNNDTDSEFSDLEDSDGEINFYNLGTGKKTTLSEMMSKGARFGPVHSTPLF